MMLGSFGFRRAWPALALLLLPWSSFSQSSPAAAIASARLALRDAFRNDDLAGASLLMDSLLQLEDGRHVALVWDERWLLYCWMGLYGNLFDEAARFDAAQRAALADKVQPPADSLFETVDRGLFDQRYQLFEQLRHSMLSEEERAFAVLQLDYLLRLDAPGEGWNQRADAFLTRYPQSRFTNYLRSIRPRTVRPGRSALTGDLSLLSGSWRDELDRTVRPLWGGELGLAFWHRRWALGARMSVGGARLRRDVEQAGYIWPEDDQTVFFGLELETGYDLIHTAKVRFTPLVGGGFTVLAPPSGDEEEDPLPEYYENFRFFSGSVFGALQADLRLGDFSGEEEEFAQGSSHGLRLRAGYRRMYFDRKNPFLAGDMVFLSVGYQLFGRLEKG